MNLSRHHPSPSEELTPNTGGWAPPARRLGVAFGATCPRQRRLGDGGWPGRDPRSWCGRAHLRGAASVGPHPRAGRRPVPRVGLVHHRRLPPALRAPQLSCFGASALVLPRLRSGRVPNSALAWSADHRAHHADTDGPDDPHAITKGVWWAHPGGSSGAKGLGGRRRLSDLWAIRSVRLQRRFYPAIAIAFGLGMPTAVAATWNDPWGGLLVAGFLQSGPVAGDVLREFPGAHAGPTHLRRADVGP